VREEKRKEEMESIDAFTRVLAFGGEERRMRVDDGGA